jgi:hypothetical protein
MERANPQDRALLYHLCLLLRKCDRVYNLLTTDGLTNLNGKALNFLLNTIKAYALLAAAHRANIISPEASSVRFDIHKFVEDIALTLDPVVLALLILIHGNMTWLETRLNAIMTGEDTHVLHIRHVAMAVGDEVADVIRRNSGHKSVT